ncbi:SxtJ family membrane protein [Gammaproteobacteria bacterium]|nr:SxtJ family membrane protein [Gammaproteobacteria bacterium]
MNVNNIELPSNRKFGLFFTLVFMLASSYFYIKLNLIAVIFFLTLSLLTLFVTLVKDELLDPFNKLWMRIGILIGMVVSPLIMGIIFIMMFVPSSLLMKLLGRDELRLILKNKKTHWKNRDFDLDKSNSFKNQF